MNEMRASDCGFAYVGAGGRASGRALCVWVDGGVSVPVCPGISV